MARIEISCFVRHLTERGIDRSQDEWAAHHITKAVKGEAIRGHFDFPVRGVTRVINEALRGELLGELYRQTARHIVTNIRANVDIVPIPNSSAVVTSSAAYQTLRLARGIAAEIGAPAQAVDLLRWKTAQEKAHKGGRVRDHNAHYNNLAIVGAVNRDIILFDDVVTSGSQMFASFRKLRDAGFNVIAMYSIVDILDHGLRGDCASWKTTHRVQYEAADLF